MKFPMILAIMLLIVTAAAIAGCASTNQSDYSGVAKDFVMNSDTYRFDGIADTVNVTNSSGYYIVAFDSRHEGYGDRHGQVMSEVITHHICTVAVKDGKVANAVMDGRYDMMTNTMIQIPQPTVIPPGQATIPAYPTAPITTPSPTPIPTEIPTATPTATNSTNETAPQMPALPSNFTNATNATY